jgi:ATP synthase protein I
MLRTVSLQTCASIVAALVAYALAGWYAAVSALLGGIACVVPNALFALRLASAVRRPGGTTVATFFVGEFVKLGLTVAILLAIAKGFHELNWLALLAGFIVALKSYYVAFLLLHRQ